MNITEFLEARITEDEAAARAAIDPARPGVQWQWVTNETDRVVANGDLAEAQEYQKISLRTVEEYPTSAGELPGFLIGYAEEVDPGAGEHIARHDPARVLAECRAKRAIIEQHKDWPVLVERKPEFTEASNDIHSMTYRATQEMAWLTEREYVKRFGVEAPTTNMIRALAAVYADHPDYQQEWARG